MRGKLRQPKHAGPACRIIPAHAGQTSAGSTRSTCPSDHPRACGANGVAHADAIQACGSSPRMRGKLGVGLEMVFGVRIIPAHAGQTSRSACLKWAASDHPRACGANPEHVSFTQFTVGSSPRMRGKPVGEPFPCVAVRIIPAHAGQTCDLLTGSCRHTDHPRACGANTSRPRCNAIMHGSSPRMRGKLRVRVERRAVFRIIPAHAGQTISSSVYGRRSADHPRACGANSSPAASLAL